MRRWLLFFLVVGLIMASLDFSLYGKQFEFAIKSNAHYSALVGGIGSGKSRGGATRALLAAYGQVGGLSIPTPNTGMVTAPTYNILRDATLPTFREVAGDLIDIKNSAFSPPIHVRMKNGGLVTFRSADNPEHLRGPNLSWWWGDEPSLSEQLLWKIAIGRLREFGRFGYAWLTFTPQGRNWIWQRFIQRGGPNYYIARVRSRDNPFLDEEFLKALEEDYSGDFAKQELEGEFVAFEGLIYPEFRRDLHVTSDIPQYFSKTFAGVDWGFVNPGVINVYGLTGDGRMYLVHEEYKRRRGIDEWADVALQLRNIWHIQDFYCDPSEPDYIRKFQEKGCNTWAADNTVSTGIQAVKRRFAIRADGKPGLMYYPGAVYSTAENEQYQWAKKGDISLDQPVKANDHTRDAERYAVMAVDGGSGPLEVSVGRWA